MHSAARLELFVDRLSYPEAPRWHAGALWLSDFYTHRVLRVDDTGRVQTEAEVPGQPSGLGWLPDGRLLAVSMVDHAVVRREEDGRVVRAADLSALARAHCNDMVVDAQGRAYVGHFGFDLQAKAPFQTASLILVLPDGTARTVADELHFPNGMAITPDGRTLLVGESYAARITAFDIAPDGSLGRRRIWAQLKGATPDGICLDAEGAVWVASPISREVLRVHAGGEVSERIPTESQAVACMLGGPDRRTLFVCTGKVITTPEQARAALSGRVWRTEVAVPGAGWP